MSGDVEPRPGGRARGLRPATPRQELTLALLLGALGAGLIFLATRQGWAQVRTTPPRPLPASRIEVTGAALVPYADALVVAGLATLAAVLASRRLLRRLTGGLFAVIAVSLAVSAFTRVAGRRDYRCDLQHQSGVSGRGSVTDGSGAVQAVPPDVAGTSPACDLLGGRLAGDRRRGRDSDVRRRDPDCLAGRADGGDVEPV